MKTFRILNIWLHGKLNLCKKMKWDNIERGCYFSWYGKYPNNKKDVREFFKRRSELISLYHPFEKH